MHSLILLLQLAPLPLCLLGLPPQLTGLPSQRRQLASLPLLVVLSQLSSQSAELGTHVVQMLLLGLLFAPVAQLGQSVPQLDTFPLERHCFGPEPGRLVQPGGPPLQEGTLLLPPSLLQLG